MHNPLSTGHFAGLPCKSPPSLQQRNVAAVAVQTGYGRYAEMQQCVHIMCDIAKDGSRSSARSRLEPQDLKQQQQQQQQEQALHCLQQLQQFLAQPTPPEGVHTSSMSAATATTLTAKHTARCAWALKELKQQGLVDSATAKIVMNALLEHASNACKEGGWREWSGLLHAAAALGLRADRPRTYSKAHHQPSTFERAFNVALPELLEALDAGASPSAQDVSNLLYAAAQGGISSPQLRPLIAAVAAGVQEGCLMSGAQPPKPQAWSNILWALARLGVYEEGLLDVGAAAVAQHAADASPQELSNTLWALASLGGWYHGGRLLSLITALLVQLQPTAAGVRDASNALWSLSKLSWHDAPVYDQLLAVITQSGGGAVAGPSSPSSGATRQSGQPPEAADEEGGGAAAGVAAAAAPAPPQQAAPTAPTAEAEAAAASTQRLEAAAGTTSTATTRKATATPQQLSNALLACARALHSSDAVARLARRVATSVRSSPQAWAGNTHALGNALHSWAVLEAGCCCQNGPEWPPVIVRGREDASSSSSSSDSKRSSSGSGGRGDIDHASDSGSFGGGGGGRRVSRGGAPASSRSCRGLRRSLSSMAQQLFAVASSSPADAWPPQALRQVYLAHLTATATATATAATSALAAVAVTATATATAAPSTLTASAATVTGLAAGSELLQACRSEWKKSARGLQRLCRGQSQHPMSMPRQIEATFRVLGLRVERCVACRGWTRAAMPAGEAGISDGSRRLPDQASSSAPESQNAQPGAPQAPSPTPCAQRTQHSSDATASDDHEERVVVEMRVRHPACPRGISVVVVPNQDLFWSPRGRVAGPRLLRAHLEGQVGGTLATVTDDCASGGPF